ncbi:MAG: hypothetical protein ACTSR2_05990 [Candidatus Hodarchaeales archaeon]
MESTSTEKQESSFLQRAWTFLLYKLYYGATYKGMITFTIVWEFCIVLFLSTFSAPVVEIFGQPLIPIVLEEGLEAQMGRIIMLYHSLAVPFLAVCAYFVLEFMDVREKFESRVKWPLFIGSILASFSAITFAYVFPDGWILHGLFLVGLSLCFYAGVMLLIGVFPTRSFPKREGEGGPYIKGINIAQLALAILTTCVLLSVMLGAAIGAFFGNSMMPFLAEYFLRSYELNSQFYEILWVDGIKAHLHVMLALIDAIILLVTYRYTVPDQKGKWYLTSMVLVIPGIVILSIGSWLVTISETHHLHDYFDPHYLIYVGASFLLFVALVLALTGWNKASKEVLGEAYESASWLTRIKAVFKAPVKLALYFQFIWVNMVMTGPGIFLAFSLKPDSIISRATDIVSFRDGPYFVELTVARGHWHVLAVLSSIVLLLFFIDYIDIQGLSRKVMAWLLFVGSIVGFGAAVIYMYGPHLDPNVMNFLGDPTSEAYIAATPIIQLMFYFIDIGIVLISIAIVVFCFHQLIEIIKGKKDVYEFPE